MKLDQKDQKILNLEYKKYLYEKYKPTFSNSSLTFIFRGGEYKLDELMVEFHRIEQDKIYLDYCVTALFIFLLCLGYWGVVALDAYLQSAR